MRRFFKWVRVLLPAWQALVQHLHVTIPGTIQFLIGQTGQMVWAASIENHGNIAWDLSHANGQHAQGNGHGSGEMPSIILFSTPDIHEHLRTARIELLFHALYTDERNGDG